jgi:hypothetical protein
VMVNRDDTYIKEIMSPLIFSYKLSTTNPTSLNKNLVLEI